MKTRNIIMIVALVLLFVAAGVLVAIGVTTHEEAGFTSPENAWEGAPLTVSCAGWVPELQPGCEHASRVVINVNQRLGFEMLTWQENDNLMVADPTADIRVLIGAPVLVGGRLDYPDANGLARVRATNGRYRDCNVSTRNTGTDEMLYLVLHHEIACHCLGLAHDDFDSSICRAVQSPTPDGAFPPRLTDYDRGLVRERYLR